jgi:hypothetical protein
MSDYDYLRPIPGWDGNGDWKSCTPPIGTGAGSPTKQQIGGDHYLKMKIQPFEFSMANNLDPCQHTIIKYVTRQKGDRAKRLEDMDKAIHTIEIYKQWIMDNE